MSATVPVVDDLPADTGARAVAQVQRQLADQAASGGAGDGDVLPSANPETPETVDLSLISIPKSDKLPPHMQKLAGKNFSQISEHLLHSEQWASSKAQEAAAAKRESEDLRIKLAVAEQLARTQHAPPAPIDETPPDLRFLGNPAAEAQRIADAAAAKSAKEVEERITGRIDGERAQEYRVQALTQTFDAAQSALVGLGYDALKDRDTWVKRLSYIVPLVDREEQVMPGALTTVDRYVAHFVNLFGEPQQQKPAIPTEQAPSSGAKPSGNVVTREGRTVPTIDREEKAKRQAIANTFVSAGHMTKEQADSYVRGER